MSVNQPVHIQGCGDFNIDKIEAAEEPCSSGRKAAANGVQGMDMAGSGAAVLAVADMAKRQGVIRLNTPDPLAGEQTWPTQEVSFRDCVSPCQPGCHPCLLNCHSAGLIDLLSLRYRIVPVRKLMQCIAAARVLVDNAVIVVVSVCEYHLSSFCRSV